MVESIGKIKEEIKGSENAYVLIQRPLDRSYSEEHRFIPRLRTSGFFTCIHKPAPSLSRPVSHNVSCQTNRIRYFPSQATSPFTSPSNKPDKRFSIPSNINVFLSPALRYCLLLPTMDKVGIYEYGEMTGIQLPVHAHCQIGDDERGN